MSVASVDATASLQLDAPTTRFRSAMGALLMVYPSIAMLVLPHPAGAVDSTGQMR